MMTIHYHKHDCTCFHKQAASCEGEGFKRVKLRKEGLKGLEKLEVGKVRNSKSLKLEKFEVGKD